VEWANANRDGGITPLANPKASIPDPAAASFTNRSANDSMACRSHSSTSP